MLSDITDHCSPQTIGGYVKSKLSVLIDKLQLVSKNKVLSSIVRSLVLFAICTYLILKLSAIGWTNIVQFLPSSPLFYLLSIVFVSLPILAEKIAFHMARPAHSIGGQSSPSLKIFARKHVINKAVMNYAGEGYFIHELSKLEGLSFKSAAIIVKNLTLIRTFSANFWVIVLVLATLILGNSNVLNNIMETSPHLVIAVAVTAIGACLAGIVFFRKLTRLKLGVASKIAAVYLLRSVIAAGVLIAQWILILPGIPLAIWGLFLMVFFIAKKSPIGGELVFISVALTLPGFEGDNAAVAAMLLTMAAVVQMLYSLGFVLTSNVTLPKFTNLTQIFGVISKQFQRS